MKLEILNFDDDYINWIYFYLPFFRFWIITEKGLFDGNTFLIGIRFGSKIFARKWGR